MHDQIPCWGCSQKNTYWCRLLKKVGMLMHEAVHMRNSSLPNATLHQLREVLQRLISHCSFSFQVSAQMVNPMLESTCYISEIRMKFVILSVHIWWRGVWVDTIFWLYRIIWNWTWIIGKKLWLYWGPSLEWTEKEWKDSHSTIRAWNPVDSHIPLSWSLFVHV